MRNGPGSAAHHWRDALRPGHGIAIVAGYAHFAETRRTPNDARRWMAKAPD
jgi:hypothetical protein